MKTGAINILIIDDDKDVCELLKNLLAEDGYNVETVTNPLLSLKRMKEKIYHLIILDLKMPDISGADLLKKIKKINTDISVIILTAYPTLESAVETLKGDASDYLKKPFDIVDLRQKIKNALRSRMLLLDEEEELNIKIGNRLRELRKEKKFTLKQLAERAGVSVSLVSQIERAECASSISTLNKISRVLGVRLNKFFEEIQE